MKISKETKESVKKSMQIVLNALGYTTSRVQYEKNPLATMNQLYVKMYMCKTYPDTNPNILIEGKRVLIHDPEFKIYPDNSTRDHLNIMLKCILKEWS